jgi:hypothetical protein
MMQFFSLMKTQVLNKGRSKSPTPGAKPATAQLATALNKSILKLYGTHLKEDGRAVDYEGLQADPGWKDYVVATEALAAMDLKNFSLDEKKCFFLNLYNMLMIHGTISIGAPKTSAHRMLFFSSICYDVGGHVLSLNDIEHGILRANRAAPPRSSGPYFNANDAKQSLSLHQSEFDPRIHFSLVCGAKGCPPIRIYTVENLERGLELAAKGFCDSNVSVDTANRIVTLSCIFQWYASDFGPDATAVLRYITRHLSDPAPLQQLLTAGSSSPHIEYAVYDWDSNAVEH